MASRHQPKIYKGRDRDARGYQRKQPEVTYDQEELSNEVEVHPVTTTPTVSLLYEVCKESGQTDVCIVTAIRR